MVAGLEEPTAGQVLLGDQDISRLRPYKRPVNTVFQSYALFPHLDIVDNVAFGLRRARHPRDVASRSPRCSSWCSSTGYERAPARPALRRPAAAGRAGPGAGQPPAGAAARRAARRARPQAAPADADRAQAHPDRGRHHLRARHPRPGGGHDDGRHGRGDERRAASSSSARRPRSTSSRPPPFVANFLGQSNLIGGDVAGRSGDDLLVTAHGSRFAVPAARSRAAAGRGLSGRTAGEAAPGGCRRRRCRPAHQRGRAAIVTDSSLRRGEHAVPGAHRRGAPSCRSSPRTPGAAAPLPVGRRGRRVLGPGARVPAGPRARRGRPDRAAARRARRGVTPMADAGSPAAAAPGDGAAADRHGGRSPAQRRRRCCRTCCCCPARLWLVLFFAVPAVPARRDQPVRPERVAAGRLRDDLARSATTRTRWPRTGRTSCARSLYAGIATVICLLLGYPLAYAIAQKAGRWKNLMLVCVIAPFFTSFLVRTLAWKTILSDSGWLVGVAARRAPARRRTAGCWPPRSPWSPG